MALSLPWYIRNLLEAHDPTPPMFSLLFDHPDPVFTQADAAWIYLTGKESGLKHPLSLLLLPFQYFTAPGKPPFGRDGISAAFLLLYAPVIVLLVLLCWRKGRHVPQSFVYLSVAVLYLAIPWFYNADGRHALHWYPVLVAWIGVGISFVWLRASSYSNARTATRIHVATVAFCCALIVPSPTDGSIEFYRNYYQETSELAHMNGDRTQYLEKNVRGYQAVEAVTKTLVSEHKQQTHVLVREGMTPPHFYFRKTQTS